MEDKGVGDQEQCGQMQFRGISLTWDQGWSVEEAEIAAQDHTVWKILTSQAAGADLQDADW